MPRWVKKPSLDGRSVLWISLVAQCPTECARDLLFPTVFSQCAFGRLSLTVLALSPLFMTLLIPYLSLLIYTSVEPMRHAINGGESRTGCSFLQVSSYGSSLCGNDFNVNCVHRPWPTASVSLPWNFSSSFNLVIHMTFKVLEGKSTQGHVFWLQNGIHGRLCLNHSSK